MRILFTIQKEDIKDLLRYGVLRAEVLENPGLYNGRLGMAILFYEYSRYYNDSLYEQFADEIMDSILELPNTLPLNFSDGLSGIGWGMIYLQKNGFIEGNINDILSSIDDIFIKLNIDRLNKDYSIYLDMKEGNTSNEDEILKNILRSCFYSSFSNNSIV